MARQAYEVYCIACRCVSACMWGMMLERVDLAKHVIGLIRFRFKLCDIFFVFFLSHDSAPSLTASYEYSALLCIMSFPSTK